MRSRARSVMLAVSALVVVVSGLQAQRFVIGIKGGANFAGVSTDVPVFEDSGRRTAFVGGGFLTIGVGELSSIQPEVLYSRRGFTVANELTDATVKADYIEVPVLLKGAWTLGDSGVRSGLYLGGSFLFRTTCRVEGQLGEFTVDGDCESPAIDLQYKTTDFGLVLGVEFYLPIGLGWLVLDGRYNYGLPNLDDHPDTEGSIKSRVWTAMAGIAVPISR